MGIDDAYIIPHRIQSASESRELAIATVTAEVSLSVEFIKVMTFMAVQGACQTHTSCLTSTACGTRIQRLATNVALCLKTIISMSGTTMTQP